MDGENTFMKIRVFGEPKKKEAIKPLKFNKLIAQNVRPWGVEPQSKEPESFILSIELRAQISISTLSNVLFEKRYFESVTKIQLFSLFS